MPFKITRIQRLSAVISISTCFFVAEISVGFYTGSLALIADAFHYLNDLVGLIIALVASIVAKKHTPPKSFTFGWQRAQLLGAFANGVLLFGLGISIFLQSIERFITLERIEQPKLVLIMGCIGLGLNMISALFLHEHDHGNHNDGGDGIGNSHAHDHGHEHGGGSGSGHLDSIDLMNANHLSHKHVVNASAGSLRSGKDLAMMGVFIHVLGDAGNNIGVIIAALVIWTAHYGGRYYADPAVSMAISLMIFASSVPLIKRAGTILLQSAPDNLQVDDVTHDLEQIPGILAVHELHIWRLDQKKTLASAHIVLSDKVDFNALAKTVNECFHAYGIHSVTLQPERELPKATLSSEPAEVGTMGSAVEQSFSKEGRRRVFQNTSKCQLGCGDLCDDVSCCR